MEVTVGGRQAWLHEDEHGYGSFHTFDNFRINPNDPFPRKIHVLLPSRYVREEEERHPVLYFQDGHKVFWSNRADGSGSDGGQSWNVLQQISELKQELLREKSELANPILVAIYPIDRAFEYTNEPWQFEEPHQRGNRGGGISAYSDYVIALKTQFIDRYYRTSSNLEDNAIVGSSFGGSAAFYIGMKNPHHFGLICALSPAFWNRNNRIDEYLYGGYHRGRQLSSEDPYQSDLIDQLEEALSQDESKTKLFMTIGQREEGIRASLFEMLRVMTDHFGYHIKNLNEDEEQRGRGETKGKIVFLFEDPLGGHEEGAWSYQFRLFIKKFFSSREQTKSQT